MSFSSDIPLQSNQLPISIDFPNPQEKVFLDVLTNTYKRIANSVNTREGSLYLLEEQATFQQYFTAGDPQRNRNTYRMVVDFGALPDTGPKPIPHNINFDSNFTTTRIYASATDPVALEYIPIPYASPTLTENIELSLNATHVIITTGSNRSAFTRCTVVIEYMKNL